MFRRDDPLSHYRGFVLPFLDELGIESLGPELEKAAVELASCIEELDRTTDEWRRENLIDNYWLWWTRFQSWLCEG